MGSKRMSQRMARYLLFDTGGITATFNAFCKLVSCIWWRRTNPLRGSTDNLLAANTYCQRNPFPAFGYLRANASGRKTASTPNSLSRWWIIFLSSTVFFRSFRFFFWQRCHPVFILSGQLHEICNFGRIIIR